MYGKKREGEESWQEAVERVLKGKGKDWMKEGEGGRNRRERGEGRERGRERRK